MQRKTNAIDTGLVRRLRIAVGQQQVSTIQRNLLLMAASILLKKNILTDEENYCVSTSYHDNGGV